MDQSWSGDSESMLISAAMLCKCDVTIYSVVCGILLMAIELGADWEPVNDGGGHLALVLMC